MKLSLSLLLLAVAVGASTAAALDTDEVDEVADLEVSPEEAKRFFDKKISLSYPEEAKKKAAFKMDRTNTDSPFAREISAGMKRMDDFAEGLKRWEASVDTCKDSLTVHNIVSVVQALNEMKGQDFSTGVKCKFWYLNYVTAYIMGQKSQEPENAAFSCAERMKQGVILLQFLESVKREEAQCLVCSFRRIVQDKLKSDKNVFESLLPPGIVRRLRSLEDLSQDEKDELWETRATDKALSQAEVREKYEFVYKDRASNGIYSAEKLEKMGDTCLVPLIVDADTCADTAEACTLKTPTWKEVVENSFSGDKEKLFLAEGFNVLINMFRKDIKPKGWNFFIEQFAAASQDGFYNAESWAAVSEKFDILDKQRSAGEPLLRTKSRRRVLQRDSSFS